MPNEILAGREKRRKVHQQGGDDQGAVGQRVGDVGRLALLVVSHVQAAWRIPRPDLGTNHQATVSNQSGFVLPPPHIQPIIDLN